MPPRLDRASYPFPFQNLLGSKKGRWGEGLTAHDMDKCRCNDRICGMDY